MADSLVVEYQKLRELGQRLVDLRGEFEKGSDALDPLIHLLSCDELREQLRKFGDDWSDRRDGIVQQMNQASGFATAAADQYQGLDNDLANAFRSEQS